MATIRKIRIVQQEGKRNVERELDFYQLKAILAVGYRVNSKEATAFRRWATNTLDEFVTKGYVLDKERLKKGPQFGKDYFKDLLEQIREIRASERRFYQKITDIYALSTDYDKDAPETREFFATVQNKLHWAISGKTAAEIIYYTADATQPHMGLTTWKHAPEGKILKSDVTVAKNYLPEKHIKALDRIVKFSIANVPFEENDKIDYETYFNDIVGVTHDGKHPDVEHVVLKFPKGRFPYVVSKPIHHSQQIVSSDDGILSIDVRVNQELEQTIFSFGQQVEVLAPEWFRDQIKEKYKEIIKIYEL
jgi:hypothetical protein